MFNRQNLMIVLAAVFTGLGFVAAQHYFARPAAPDLPALESVLAYPQPRPLPPFTLQSLDGPVTADTLRGRWTLVFIGFVSCPDVCPTTLADLARAQKAWEALPEAQRPRLLFVSVDPERDSLQLLADYAKYFHPGTLAATQPDLAQLEAFTSSLSMVFRKVPMGESYTMDHSSSMVLLDPQVRVAGVIRPKLPPADAASSVAHFDVDALLRDIAALTERAP
jgi:protein SCO1/2